MNKRTKGREKKKSLKMNKLRKEESLGWMLKKKKLKAFKKALKTITTPKKNLKKIKNLECVMNHGKHGRKLTF